MVDILAMAKLLIVYLHVFDKQIDDNNSVEDMCEWEGERLNSLFAEYIFRW